MGYDLAVEDWDRLGFHIPLLNMQAAGRVLGKEYFRAGGLPAIIAELLEAGKLNANALRCTGRTVAENVGGKQSWDSQTIGEFKHPILKSAGSVFSQPVQLSNHKYLCYLGLIPTEVPPEPR
jgi:dihydroxy-acid dehydratase